VIGEEWIGFLGVFVDGDYANAPGHRPHDARYQRDPHLCLNLG
jgi:hypothetical protein